MQFLIVLVILSAVVLVVLWPVLRARPRGAAESDQLAELEAAREAKYREIRDAELDHRTGKLSDGDYRAVDDALRAEAMEIIRAIDQAADTAPGSATIADR